MELMVSVSVKISIKIDSRKVRPILENLSSALTLTPI